MPRQARRNYAGPGRAPAAGRLNLIPLPLLHILYVVHDLRYSPISRPIAGFYTSTACLLAKVSRNRMRLILCNSATKMQSSVQPLAKPRGCHDMTDQWIRQRDLCKTSVCFRLCYSHVLIPIGGCERRDRASSATVKTGYTPSCAPLWTGISVLESHGLGMFQSEAWLFLCAHTDGTSCVTTLRSLCDHIDIFVRPHLSNLSDHFG